MKLIIFQKFNYNYVFFIFYLIFCISYAIIEVNYTNEQLEIKIKGNGHFLQVIVYITVCLSDSLAFIPYYINKKLTKTKNASIKKDEDESNVNNDFIYNNPYLEETRKKSDNLKIYTFLVGLCDFIAETVYFLYY